MSTRNRWIERIVLLLHRLHPSDFRERFGGDLRTDLRLVVEGDSSVARYRTSRVGLIGDSVRTLLRAWGSRLRPSGFGGPGRAPLRGLRQDVRSAFRTIWRYPVPTCVTILTLAVGIGANSTVFAVFHTLLLDPLSYGEAENLGVFPHSAVNITNDGWRVSDAVRNAPGVEATAYYIGDGSANFVEGSESGRARIAQVSHDFLEVLGSTASPGSTLASFPERTDVAMLSHDFWVRAFGSDPGVVGSNLILSGQSYTVTGIAAPGADFPGKTEVWVPGPTNFDFFGGAVAAAALVRLSPEAERAAIEREVLLRIEAQYAEFGAEFDRAQAPTLTPLRDMISGAVHTPLLVLMASTVMILLLACANLAGVSLARLAARQGELRSRVALGATRARIRTQLLTETLVIALLSGVVSLVIAVVAVPALVALFPAETPGLDAVDIGPATAISALGATVLAGILIGVLPAFEGARLSVRGRLSPGRSDDRRIRRVREVLTVAQICAAAVLLVGSSLLLKSLAQLRDVEYGYDLDNVVTFQVHLPSNTYADREERTAYQRQVHDRIAELPGVSSVGAVSRLPLAPGLGIGISLEREDSDGSDPVRATQLRASPSYFAAMGISFVEGETFEDVPSPESRVVLSKQLADSLFSGGSAVNRLVRLNSYRDTLSARVVGVIENVRLNGFRSRASMAYYEPLAESPSNAMGFAVHVAGPVRERIDAIRAVLAGIDGRVPAFSIRTTGEAATEELAERRAVSIVVTILALLAAFLVAIGLYGILAQGVVQRRREIGIRMALGAHGFAVIRAVILRSMALTAFGAVLGLAIASVSVSKLEAVLFEVSLWDPALWSAALGTILALGAASSWFPAWTAARIDPASAFRTE